MAQPSIPDLQKLHRLNALSSDFGDQVRNVLCGKEYVECVPNLGGDDLIWLVDYLDKALDTLEPSGAAFRKCLRELRNICGARAILPTSYTLSSRLLDVSSGPFASGGFGDVYKGTLDGSTVCIKRARIYIKEGSEKVIKAFCQEAVIWKRLTHPNIVPLLGITFTPFQLILGWMSGGNLSEYIRKHPDVDRRGPLSDVANGLCYLHSCNVIHGDLKGANILVDDTGHACIADFGLAMVTKDLDSGPSTSRHHTPRWTAPEVLTEGIHSKEADIFSFAMVMYEAFASTVPFSGKSPTAAMFDIISGIRPPRPRRSDCTEELWSLMQGCWAHDPHSRPGVSEVLERLLTLEIPARERKVTPASVTDDHAAVKVESTTSVLPDVDVSQPTIFSAGLPSHPALQKLHHLDTSSPDFQEKLLSVVYGEDYAQCLRNLGSDELTWLVDYLDKALNVFEPSSVASRKCLRELRRICGTRAILPTSYSLSSRLLNVSSEPFASGGFGDVYEGSLNGSKVCIKRVRVYTQDDPKEAAKAFCQEVVMWKRLVHPNIVPLLGIAISPQFQLVSDWISGGDLPRYVKKHPNANRVGLLTDVANGLHYLHSCNVIHGDLKGPNILVDDSNHARITDFGLAMVTKNLDSIPSASRHHGLTLRWTAPEVLSGGAYTREADVFSFAMVMYEVFTGAVPFSEMPSIVAMFNMVGGKRPPKPTHPDFIENLWSLMQRCWAHDPHSRPEASESLVLLLTLDTPPEGSLTIPTVAIDDRTEAHTTMVTSDVPQSMKFPAAPPNSPVLQELHRIHPSSPDFDNQLYNVLSGEEYVRCVTNLQDDDLAWLVDYLGNALDCLASPSATFRKCLGELKRIRGTRMTLPRSHARSSHLTDDQWVDIESDTESLTAHTGDGQSTTRRTGNLREGWASVMGRGLRKLFGLRKNR